MKAKEKQMFAKEDWEKDDKDGDYSNDTYKIIRYSQTGNNHVIKRGLTLEQAKAHCSDPSTHRTKGDGHDWFDGYTKE